MRFGFYSPYLDTFGGGERYMLTLASYLSKDNIVDIFWDDKTIKGPLTRFLKINLGNCTFKENIFKFSIFKKISLTTKYDLIFILSDGSIPSTFAKINILHFQVPFQLPKMNIQTKLKLKKYNAIVVNSNFTKKFIDQSFNVNSKVIYPPVDIKSIKPLEKEKIILSVGRFSPNQLHPKRQETLIEVFKEIYKKSPQWKLVLVGQAKKQDLKYLRNLKKQSRGYAIKIIENMSFEKLKALYGKTSIYWHATGFADDEQKYPQKMEHFGISTVEASAAGAVPVVIAKGGQKEIIQESKNGFLWLTKSQLFEKTQKLIENKSLLNKLSLNAQKNSKRFSQEIFFNEYEKIIFSKN